MPKTRDTRTRERRSLRMRPSIPAALFLRSAHRFASVL